MFKKRELRRIFLIFCATVVVSGIINGTAFADRNVIIGFHQNDDQTKEKLVHDNGGKVKKNFHIISAISASMSDENITKMKKDPRVAYIENDSIFRIADAYSDEYNNSWGVQHIGSQITHDNGINGKGVNVSVLDTGIDYNHIDLKDNYKGGYNFVNLNSDPWDDNCLSQNKECHGTHVSGIIGAEKNGIGVVGVAPNVNLYAVKVMNGGGLGDVTAIISGLEWAVDNKMDIVVMSFGDSSDNLAIHTAVDNAYNAGLLLVAAAGNTDGGSVMYPAGYDSVIAVSATDRSDLNTNFDPIDPKIELSAPGVDINSTINGGYGIKSGTSMAAPHVAGVAALIYSTNFPDVNGDGVRNNTDVRIILQKSAKDLGGPGRDIKYGYGLVDVQNAILMIQHENRIEILLKRGTGPEINDSKNISLSPGNYSIDIRNVNLTKIDMKVYENGIIRKDLSSTIKFNKSNEVEFSMNINKMLKIVFIPYGRNGSTGYVTIEKKLI